MQPQLPSVADDELSGVAAKVLTLFGLLMLLGIGNRSHHVGRGLDGLLRCEVLSVLLVDALRDLASLGTAGSISVYAASAQSLLGLIVAFQIEVLVDGQLGLLRNLLLLVGLDHLLHLLGSNAKLVKGVLLGRKELRDMTNVNGLEVLDLSSDRIVSDGLIVDLGLILTRSLGFELRSPILHLGRNSAVSLSLVTGKIKLRGSIRGLDFSLGLNGSLGLLDGIALFNTIARTSGTSRIGRRAARIRTRRGGSGSAVLITLSLRHGSQEHQNDAYDHNDDDNKVNRVHFLIALEKKGRFI